MSNEVTPCQHCEAANVTQACPQCHTSFVCDLAQGKEHCWCMTLPTIMPVCSTAKCLCESCLQVAIDDRAKQQPHAS